METPAVMILDADAYSRKALQRLVALEGLAGMCAVVAPYSKKDTHARPGPYVWLAGEGEIPPAGLDVSMIACLTKPVRAGLLLSRIESLIKNGKYIEKWIEFGSYVFNTATHELAHHHSGVVRLTEKEGQLLALLARHPGETVNRRTLLENVWGYGDGIETHTMETHIYRLRQKLERDPAHPQILITDGTGYRLQK